MSSTGYKRRRMMWRTTESSATIPMRRMSEMFCSPSSPKRPIRSIGMIKAVTSSPTDGARMIAPAATTPMVTKSPTNGENNIEATTSVPPPRTDQSSARAATKAGREPIAAYRTSILPSIDLKPAQAAGRRGSVAEGSKVGQAGNPLELTVVAYARIDIVEEEGKRDPKHQPHGN